MNCPAGNTHTKQSVCRGGLGSDTRRMRGETARKERQTFPALLSPDKGHGCLFGRRVRFSLSVLCVRRRIVCAAVFSLRQTNQVISGGRFFVTTHVPLSSRLSPVAQPHQSPDSTWELHPVRLDPYGVKATLATGQRAYLPPSHLLQSPSHRRWEFLFLSLNSYFTRPTGSSSSSRFHR